MSFPWKGRKNMNELQLNNQMDIVGGAVGTWIVCIGCRGCGL